MTPRVLEEFAADNGARPTMVQAGVYSAVTHHQSRSFVRSDGDGAKVVEMKSMPTEDRVFGRGHIRPDGRKIHDMYSSRSRSLKRARAGIITRSAPPFRPIRLSGR